MPTAAGDHAQREQLARAGARDLPQQPGKHAAPDHQHQRDERADLPAACCQRAPDPRAPSRAGAVPPSSPPSAGSSTSTSTITRSSTTSQPTAIRPLQRVQHAARLQRAQQHHRAGHRQRQAEHQRARRRSSPTRCASARAERGGHRDLHHRARDRDPAHRQQVVEREVQADAEHQQHHADLGQLRGEADVGHEARRGRPDQHAGQQVADQRRQPQPRRDETEHQRQPERRRQSW